MQVGFLDSPNWQIAIGVLVVATMAKVILAFCKALGQKYRANGNGPDPLPAGLLRLVKDNATRDALRLGECCLAIIVHTIVFLFLWDFSSFAEPLLGIWANLGMLALVVGVTALVVHTATEKLPRLLALRSSARVWKKVFWVPVTIIWVTWLIRILAKFLERGLEMTLAVKPAHQKDGLQAEIEALGDGSGDNLSSSIREIVGNTLQLRNLHAQDILVPRNQVQVLDLNDSLEKNLFLIKTSGHTRFPLCNEDLDHCEGIVHVKDLFREIAEGKEVGLAEIKRDFATFSPETTVMEVLQKMLQGRLHMALVRDEFGGAVGVLTLEDALEEVVGEIKDEFDASEEIPVYKLRDGNYFVSGLASTHEVEEALGCKCGNEEVSTFGGWITMVLGRIPQKGEQIVLNDIEISIKESDETRVIATGVKLLKKQVEVEKPAEK